MFSSIASFLIVLSESIEKVGNSLVEILYHAWVDTHATARDMEPAVVRKLVPMENAYQVDSTEDTRFPRSQYMKVPQQDNSTDCGLFTCNYVQQFATEIKSLKEKSESTIVTREMYKARQWDWLNPQWFKNFRANGDRIGKTMRDQLAVDLDTCSKEYAVAKREAEKAEKEKKMKKKNKKKTDEKNDAEDEAENKVEEKGEEEEEEEEEEEQEEEEEDASPLHSSHDIEPNHESSEEQDDEEDDEKKKKVENEENKEENREESSKGKEQDGKRGKKRKHRDDDDDSSELSGDDGGAKKNIVEVVDSGSDGGNEDDNEEGDSQNPISLALEEGAGGSPRSPKV